MEDAKKTIKELKDIAEHFINERDWQQFHSPKNLSMNISIEAGELMEKFLWISTQESYEEIKKNRQEIEDELADIFFSVLCFANTAQIDLTNVFRTKLEKISHKYPVQKAKGRSEKYAKLDK